MNNDFDKIKELFDSDGITAPDSLSEENIFAMLPDKEPAAPDAAAGEEISYAAIAAPYMASRKKLRIYAAIAACFIVLLLGSPVIYNAIKGVPDTDLGNGQLYSFNDKGEIERLISSIEEENAQLYNSPESGDILIDEDVAINEDAAEGDTMVANDGTLIDDGPTPLASSPSGAAAEPKSDDYSQTYLQVEEVDEADIVKTDGKYIYFVNDKAEVVILSVDNGKTSVLSTIGTGEFENYIEDIYLKGDTLVTVGTAYLDGSDEGCSAVATYDISDRTSPKSVNLFRQSGFISSSRMIGDYVYLVTTDYVYRNRILPQCTISGELTDIPATSIKCVPHPVNKAYVVLSSINIVSGDSSDTKSTAVFGASDTIYCNDHHLYTAVTEWQYDEGNGSGDLYTRIIRASIDGPDVDFDATARVRGSVYGQFAMNEKDDHFFIATTSQRAGMDVNNLFVLNDKFEEVGTLSGFARNESIRAVRFIGDKVYVITYEAIDPLFVIDISDPESPQIDGEVKIDGFSTLLVPVSEDKLLGIGYATGDNGYGGEYANGLKLALFDVSEPSSPEVIDSQEFEDMESPAQNTHLALTVNTKEGWYAIPYLVSREVPDEENKYEYNYESESGVLMFEADDDIDVVDQHSLADDYLQRSLYIKNYIYALATDGTAYSFKIKK